MISIPPKFKNKAIPRAAPSPAITISAEYRFAGDGVTFLSIGQAIVSLGTVSLVAVSLGYRFALIPFLCGRLLGFTASLEY